MPLLFLACVSSLLLGPNVAHRQVRKQESSAKHSEGANGHGDQDDMTALNRSAAITGPTMNVNANDHLDSNGAMLDVGGAVYFKAEGWDTKEWQNCPAGMEIRSESECKIAAAFIAWNYMKLVTSDQRPTGCFYDPRGVYYNTKVVLSNPPIVYGAGLCKLKVPDYTVLPTAGFCLRYGHNSMVEEHFHVSLEECAAACSKLSTCSHIAFTAYDGTSACNTYAFKSGPVVGTPVPVITNFTTSCFEKK